MKTALLIIDMINGMENWIPRTRMKRIIPNLEKLIERAREKNATIIYAVHVSLGERKTKIYEEILPRKGDLKVEKIDFSSFYKTNLDKILKGRKINKLIITGSSTHWCVQTTATDAHYRKYRTVIVSDCTTAPTEKDHKRSLEWMANTLEVSIKPSNKVRF
ncbi:MAG: cysteine hydrolase [Candidatus Aenigmatarchaeota archaeon]